MSSSQDRRHQNSHQHLCAHQTFLTFHTHS